MEVSEVGVKYLVLSDIVEYASEDMSVVLLAKVDGRRTDYLQQVEELVHFAQAWQFFVRIERLRNVVRLGIQDGCVLIAATKFQKVIQNLRWRYQHKELLLTTAGY